MQAQSAKYLPTEVQSQIILEHLRDLKRNPLKPPPKARNQSPQEKQFEDYWKRFHKDQPAPKPFPKYDYTNERLVFMLFLVNKTWCQIAMEEVLEKLTRDGLGMIAGISYAIVGMR